VNVVTNNSLLRGDGTPHSCQPNELGAEASRCGSLLARIGSHSWDSGRLTAAVAALTHTGKANNWSLSVGTDGHIDTVGCRWSN
jgi:hypothetical protein